MQVYDDFLKPEIAQEAYEFVLKSYYQIGWEDSLVPEQRTYPNLHSRYNSEDIKKLNILGPIHKKLKNKNLICDKCIVNLTKPLDINFIHSHPNQVVALYYPNLTWKPEDGGETLFYKNNKRDNKNRPWRSIRFSARRTNMTNLVLVASDFGRRVTLATRGFDRAWIAVAVIFAIIAIFEPAQALASFEFALKALLGIAPFLFAAIAIAAYAKVSGADGLIAKVFEGRMTVMIIFAALFGGVSPFCSCGVIPLIAALLSMGVPVPAVMAFWLASRLMDLAVFIIASGTLLESSQ